MDSYWCLAKGQRNRGNILKTVSEDLWKISYNSKGCAFLKLLWKNLGKYVEKD